MKASVEAIIPRQSIIGVSTPIATGVMTAGATFTIGPGGMSLIGGIVKVGMLTVGPGISSGEEKNFHRSTMREDSSGVGGLSRRRR